MLRLYFVLIPQLEVTAWIEDIDGVQALLLKGGNIYFIESGQSNPSNARIVQTQCRGSRTPWWYFPPLAVIFFPRPSLLMNKQATSIFLCSFETGLGMRSLVL